METASTVIKDALQEILVQAQEQPIQAVDSSTAIRYMNRFMANLDAKGISLGYTVVSNISDPITIPDGAIEGLVFNLALRLAPSYDIPPSPLLVMNAKEGIEAMRQIAVDIEASKYPCTLPIGSGNEQQGFGGSIWHFYPCEEDDLLNENGGSINLESDTNG